MSRIAVYPALLALVFGVALSAPMAMADDPSYEITIRDHRFHPDTLQVPANKKIRLVINNADPTPEEFESYELNREKVISGKSKAIIYIGPLNPGTYPFFGEFHQKTAKGQIVAK